MKLTPVMELRLMGAGFLYYTKVDDRYKVSKTTVKGLQSRGLLDSKEKITHLGMEFVKNKCASIDKKNQERFELLTFVGTDIELLRCYNDNREYNPKIWVYNNEVPVLVSRDISEHFVLISAFYFWRYLISRTAGKFLRYASFSEDASQHNFMSPQTEDLINSIHPIIFLDK